MRIALAAIVCAALAGEAAGQYGPPPPPPPSQPPPPPPPPPPGTGPGYYAAPEPTVVRDGFTIGASIGLGGINDSSCDDCDALGGLALELHLGGMLTPRLALIGDASMIAHGDEGYALTQGILAVAAQWWILEKVWLKGGLGVGRVTEVIELPGGGELRGEDEGTGVLLGVGIEFLSSGDFTLDAQLRFAVLRYRDDVADEGYTLSNTSLHLGFNWY